MPAENRMPIAFAVNDRSRGVRPERTPAAGRGELGSKLPKREREALQLLFSTARTLRVTRRPVLDPQALEDIVADGLGALALKAAEFVDAPRRERFGIMLRRALHRVDPALDLADLTRSLELAPAHVLYPYLPIDRWPRSMQPAALDLSTEAEKAIGRFLAYVTARGRRPEVPTVADFSSYAETLSHSNTCRWNHLKRLGDHLPSVLPGCEPLLREAIRKVTVKRYVECGLEHARKKREYRTRKRGWALGVPIDEWPAPWREAFEAYKSHLEKPEGDADLLAVVAGGAPEELRIGPGTTRGIATAIARLLYAARRDPRISDPDRLAPDTLQSYLDALRERGAKDTTRAMETKFLNSFATHILGWPAGERAWIKLTYQNLKRQAKGQPRRKDGKRMPALREVWSAGQELWRRAHEIGLGSQSAFRLARDGLVLCFACNVPLRVSDLQPLKFDHDLYRNEKGWSLRVVEQTKTKKTYRNSLLWPEVGKMLDAYRDKWLPLERDIAYVWMDREPSERWLASVFKNRVGFNPHLIRDIVATEIAADGDDASGAIPSLLGHADSRTSAEYIRMSELIVGARVARRLLAGLLSEIEAVGYQSA